jgi:hypothetical protein
MKLFCLKLLGAFFFKYCFELGPYYNTSLINAYFGLDSRECKY